MMRTRRDGPGPEGEAGAGARDGRGRDGRGRDGRARGENGTRQPGGGDRGRSGFGDLTTDDVRRTATGWRVGDEEVSDLTSAMVLADLLAADLPEGGQHAPAAPPAQGRRPAPDEPAPDVRQLQETVAQLEHALTVRVRVEQAIGVLAERHRLRPRQAFELLRSAARSRGRRVLDVASEVVESASNPLLRIPEELARPPAPQRGRLSRRSHGYE
jgi:ANTAR domain